MRQESAVRSWPFGATVVALSAGLISFAAWRGGHERLLSQSVDLAHHLQLVMALAQDPALSAESVRYLAEMHSYPNGAHRLAALLFAGGLDPLSAIAILGVASVALTWVILLALVRTHGDRAMLLAVAAATAAVAAGLSLHGRELIANYFFAQVVGEAAALAALYGACRWTRGPKSLLLAALLGAYLMGFVHLLPALKLAGAFSAIFAVRTLAALVARRPLPLLDLLGVVLPPLALLANPTFLAMAKIAEHNGGITLAPALTPLSLSGLALLLGALCAWPLVRGVGGPDERRAPLHLALFAYGAAAAAFAVAQYGAWVGFGRGSEYAVLKHAFGVLSLLVVVGAALIAGSGGLPQSRRPTMAAALSLLPAAAAAGLTLFLFRAPSELPVRHMAATLAQVSEIRRANGLPEAHRIYFSSHAESPLLNYMATVAVLRAPRDANALAILFTGRPADVAGAERLVLHTGDPAYDVARCRRSDNAGPYAVVSGACVAGVVGGQRISFKAGFNNARYLTKGWAEPETGGVWSREASTVVTLPVPASVAQAAEARLDLVTFGFLVPESPTRRVRVSLSGVGAPQDHVFDLSSPGNEHIFSFALPKTARESGVVVVQMTVLNPAVPRKLGLGADDRALGVGLQEARFVITR